MSEKQTSSPFDSTRTTSFNKRAVFGRNLGSDHGLNLATSEGAHDLTSALLTEFATGPYENNMEKLQIVSDYLTGAPQDDVERAFDELKTRIKLTGDDRYFGMMVLRVAGAAGKGIRENVFLQADKPKNSVSQTSSPKSKDTKGNTPEVMPPQFSDIEDVIKYLYQIGYLKSAHAKALLIHLGYANADGVSRESERAIQGAAFDMGKRVQDAKQFKESEFERGLNIIAAFLRQKRERPDLKLTLKEEADMEQVGKAIAYVYSFAETVR